ncbi:MAG: hypothetical protein ABEJ31_12010 [Haloarculaceae archaeon]
MSADVPDQSTPLRLLQLYDPASLPLSRFLPTEDLRDVFARTLVFAYDESYDETTEVGRIDLTFGTDEEFATKLPGLGGMELVFGGPAAPSVTVGAEFHRDASAITAGGSVRLRLSREWFTPVVEGDDGWEPDPAREHVELDFGGGVTVDQDFDVSFEGTNEFTIEPAMIGDTGLVIEGTVAVDLSETTGLDASADLGLDPAWRGVVFENLALHLPADLDVPGAPDDLAFEDFHVGGGGITGTVSGEWHPGDADGELFGMDFGLREVAIEFRETALTGASIRGTLGLPFFDGPVGLVAGVAGDGSITAALDDDDGLVTVDADAFTLELDGLEFTTADAPAVTLSGTVTPKVLPDAPGVRVDALTVDADGHVNVAGGWLDLPEQYSVECYGATFEITAFGLGRNDDGSKWLGLNGAVAFVDELAAGASVDGLRVTWFDEGPHAGEAPTISFEGIGVELEIPDAVRFKGAVSYRERALEDGAVDHRFEGDIELDLLALDVAVDGKLVVGTREQAGHEYTYFAVSLGADLPTGIPLFATGLSLYGVEGLYAQNMAPALSDGEKWFTRKAGVDSWYHRRPAGAASFDGHPPKWPAHEGAMAFGAGVTLGTGSDNGFAFSGNLLLVIAFPGPTVLLNGEATVLQERSALDAGEPNFSALAVLDGQAGTFTFGLDARYRYGDGGELIDAGASVEAFYALNDPTAWHVYIGRKEPREKRVRARTFSLFESNGYVMLDPRQLALGAWYGYDAHYSYGPLGVDLDAWLSGDAVLSFDPAHFTGSVAARGAVRVHAFGFGAGISLDASIDAEVFDPFHLLGRFHVALELPGFLPDPSATVTLEWGPRPEVPTIPEPLREIAVGHELVSATWPLAVSDDPSPPPSDDCPVVPLDGRPQLAFAASVHDDGYDVLAVDDGTPDPIGENAHRVEPATVRIGDPAANEGPVDVRYGLADVRVERQVADGWEPLPDVHGSWAPVPTLPDSDRREGADPPMANTKLTLSSANPFDYVRHTGGDWGDAMGERAGAYPCLGERDCWDFAGLSTADVTVSDARMQGLPVTRIARDGAADWPLFRHVATEPVDPPAIRDVPTADGPERALVVGIEPPESGQVVQCLAIDLPEPRKSVAVSVVPDKHCDAVGLVGTDSTGEPVADSALSPAGRQRLVVTSREGTLDQVVLVGADLDVSAASGLGDLALCSVCASTGDLADVGAFETARERALREQIARLGDDGAVFDAHATYRIAVETTVRASGRGDFDWYGEEHATTAYAYFRTDGPPALGTLSTPAGRDPAQFDSGLGDLTRYVRGTVPETLPARGERPDLPRPVYRAADVGVRFERPFVDALYWRAGRDLALVLFDRNNEPARRPDGRLAVADDQWDTQSKRGSDLARDYWLRAIDRSDCVGIDEAVVARDDRLDASVGLGVLDADEVYEARLLPRLLREPFGDAAYDGGSPPWREEHSGRTAGDWTVEGHPERSGSDAQPAGDGFRLRVRDPDAPAGSDPTFVAADLSGVQPDADVVRFAAAAGEKRFRITAVDAGAGTIAIDGDPSFDRSRWSIPGRGVVRQTASTGAAPEEYSCWVREPTPGAPAPETWTDYRAATTVTVDAPDATAGLVVRRTADGGHVRYELDASADERRLVHDDGTASTVLERVSGTPVTDGRPYAVAVEAVGTEIRVFEDGDPVFAAAIDGPTQGGVALHAAGPARFGAVRVDDVSTAAPVAYRFSFTTSRFANAAHHFGSFADETWTATATTALDAIARVAIADADGPPTGEEARAVEAAIAALDRPGTVTPDRVEATVVERDGGARALLLESPEPIDWARTTVDVGHASDPSPAAVTPDGVKVTDVTYGADEAVGVLLDGATDLTDHRVEFRRGGTGYGPALEAPLFVDPMTGDGLDAYRPVDGGVRRTGEGALRIDPTVAPATVPVDERFPATAVWSVAVERRGGNAVGLAFREHGDGGYRFVVGPDGRQLVRYDVGGYDVLWRDDVDTPADDPLALRVEAREDTLWAFVDDVPVCAVADPGGAPGAFGPLVDGDEPVTVTTAAVHESAWRGELFRDSFADETLPGWTVVDEPPETTRTSDWSVSDGTLRQRSNIYGFHGAPYGEPGTFLRSEETIRDGRVTVRLRSDDDDAIGVLVRVRDEENYYRFSMDSERGYRRFDRQTDGRTVPLWHDDVAFEPGREYVLTVDCAGDRFTGSLDGVELFSVRDDAIDAGAIAPYCRANVGANFHEVAVTAAADQWCPYHAFADGEVHPAGAQLRLYAGDAPDRTGAGIAAVRAAREPQLPTTGATLRVVGPAGVRHERRHRPASAFTGVSGVALARSLDGTAALLFAGTALEPGTYRLTVTYTRAGTPTLRQAGDDSPEHVRLDVSVTE